MKIQLHNKFEITLRNKTYTAYNTLLKSVYDKIYNLEQFTSHIAVGTGLEKISFEENKLKNYLRTFSAETEEIQCDVTKGTLYIKKTSTLDENDDSTFSFSELGLASSNDFDPTIYNHVVLVDSDGNPVSITRNAGDVMQIRVTIYLELTAESQALFVSGENKLIRQILGDNLNNEDHKLYVIRGENLSENTQMLRTTPDLTNKTAFERNIKYNTDNSIDISFEAELGEGDLEEALICYADEVCMRLNALEMNEPLSLTISQTPTSGVLEIDKNVKSVTAVTATVDGVETPITDYKVIKYSKKLTDKIDNLFDQTFTASTQRFVAKDGKMIAFLKDSYMHMYSYDNYSFTKVNTTNMPTSDILKLFMFDNLAVLILTTSPYIRIFKIENNIATEQEVDMTIYNNSSYSYNWLDAEATLTKSGTIIIGIIINNEDYTPIVIKLTKAENNAYHDSISRPQLPTAKKMYAIYQNAFSEPMIGFLTDTFQGSTYYFQEEFFENTSSLRDSSEAQYQLLNSTINLQGSGRKVVSQKPTSPYLYVYYYPDFTKAPTDMSSGVYHYTSNDGNYIVSKEEDGTYKIYNFHKEGIISEFESGFPDFVDQSAIVNMDFVGDILLIFTNTLVYGICLKNSYSRIDNPTNKTALHNITYNKYNLIGSRKLEGVKINLAFGFNK